jgi:hypothetical protein
VAARLLVHCTNVQFQCVPRREQATAGGARERFSCVRIFVSLQRFLGGERLRAFAARKVRMLDLVVLFQRLRQQDFVAKFALLGAVVLLLFLGLGAGFQGRVVHGTFFALFLVHQFVVVLARVFVGKPFFANVAEDRVRGRVLGGTMGIQISFAGVQRRTFTALILGVNVTLMLDQV